MKKGYTLTRSLLINFLFVSLFLQSCGLGNFFEPNDDQGSVFDSDEEELELINDASIVCIDASKRIAISSSSTSYQSTEELVDNSIIGAMYNSLTRQETTSSSSYIDLAGSTNTVSDVINKQKLHTVRLIRQKINEKGYIYEKKVGLKRRSSINISKSLQNTLVESIPKGYELGASVEGNDCFFDALAQCLNKIYHTRVYNIGSLRGACHSFYVDNKELVDKLNAKDNEKKKIVGDEYMMIQHTDGENKQILGYGKALHGRACVEGIILSKQLGIAENGILFIELTEDLGSEEDLISFKIACVKTDGQDLGEYGLKSIGSEEAYALLSTKGMSTLISLKGSNHYVPLLQNENTDNIAEWRLDVEKRKEKCDESEEEAHMLENNEGAEYLWAAIEGNDLDIVKMLLELGVNPNTKYGNCITPLHLAVEQGNVEIIRLLIYKGANVHAKDAQGLNALYKADKAGHQEIAIGLMKKYGVIYPLHEAISNWDIEQIVHLMDVGADVNFKDIDGNTALHLAIKQVNILLRKHLSSNGIYNIDFKDMDPTSLVYQSIKIIKQDYIQQYYISVIQKLIDKGAKIHEINKRGETALHLAVEEGCIELAELILGKNPIMINQSDIIDVTNNVINNATLLHYAAKGVNLEMAKWLIAHKAAIAARDIKARTPLHWAAKVGNLAILQFLVANAPDNLIKGNNGATILNEAVKGDNLKICELLLKVGVSIEHKNIYDNRNYSYNNPLHTAARKGNLRAVQFLLKHGANINATLHGNITSLYYSAGNIEVTKFLLENGASLHMKDLMGHSLLHFAAWRNDVELINWLREKEDFDVNLTNRYGLNALHLAAQNGCLASVALLIEQGADVNAKDIFGKTPLHYTAMSQSKDKFNKIFPTSVAAQLTDYIGIVNLLLNKGADIEAKDNEGCTPLAQALKYRNKNKQKVATFLKRRGAKIDG